ncbi:MAG: hypothetical protein EXR59_05725 [Dehalococcoidia bacterium]|nr:hypothetical protein [Dehalococcoidia bacterium]
MPARPGDENRRQVDHEVSHDTGAHSVRYDMAEANMESLRNRGITEHEMAASRETGRTNLYKTAEKEGMIRNDGVIGVLLRLLRLKR